MRMHFIVVVQSLATRDFSDSRLRLVLLILAMHLSCRLIQKNEIKFCS